MPHRGARILLIEDDDVQGEILKALLEQQSYSVDYFLEGRGALKALEDVDAVNKKSAEYHKLYGALALATRSFQAAEMHFEQVVKLEPDNPVPAVQLGMLLIQHDEPVEATRGLKMLESLSTNPLVRLDALRHLAFDAFRHTNHARALKLAEEVMAGRTVVRIGG